MAKMFYSLDEAASKLKKSEADVRQMAAKGEITEFRDGDRLIFKREQIDLLAGDDDADMSSMIPLMDSSAGAPGLGLGLADSAVGKEGPKERTGISVFDADELESADAAAQTQLDVGGQLESVNLENFGSGSGLMEMTREADDTSLGGNLMADVNAGTGAGMASQGTGSAPAFGGGGDGGGGLFEGSAGGGDAAAGAGMAMVAAEAYDAKGSGLAAGLSIGAMLSLAVGTAAILMGVFGAAPSMLTDLVGGNLLILVGGLAALTLVLGGVGFAVAKK
ncbi:MAG: helix-turn-helix domain-containing protein [Phycisphaerales bacterium]